jgi:hypothetical protein
MTPAKSPPDIRALRGQLRRGGAMLWLGATMTGGAALQLVWLGVRRVLGVVFALVVLFEQWGWRPLSNALKALAHLAPVAALERVISRLPPYGALVTFALPSALLVPLKLTALYLIANGHAFSAGALFIGAKIVGTAVVARLYQLTEPQLMQIAWVRRVHDVVMPRLHAVHEAIRQSWAWRYGRILKFQIKRALAPVVAQIKARLLALLSLRRGPV